MRPLELNDTEQYGPDFHLSNKNYFMLVNDNRHDGIVLSEYDKGVLHTFFQMHRLASRDNLSFIALRTQTKYWPHAVIRLFPIEALFSSDMYLVRCPSQAPAYYEGLSQEKRIGQPNRSGKLLVNPETHTLANPCTTADIQHGNLLIVSYDAEGYQYLIIIDGLHGLKPMILFENSYQPNLQEFDDDTED